MKKTVKVTPKKMSLQAPPKENLLYDRDFLKWTKRQAGLLQKGKFEKLDKHNLIEEIESLGRNDKRSLRSQAVVLLMHLLKREYQSEKKGNSNSWQSSILNASREIHFLIEDSPSLKNELIKIFPKAYEIARHDAAIETKLDINVFPLKCPWEIEEILQGKELDGLFEEKTSKKSKKKK